MSAGRHIRALRAARLLPALALAGLLVAPLPAAQADRPRIDWASATHDADPGRVAFSINVHDANRVAVFFRGQRYGTHKVRNLREWWETRWIAAERQCRYRIKVVARNSDGRRTKRLRAGRRGADNDPDCR